MSELTPSEARSSESSRAQAALREKWKWFIALGALLIVVGLVASYHILTATLTSVIFIGILMLIGGVGMLVHAWRVQGWGSFLLWTVSGILYLAAGVVAFYNPLVGATLFTLLIGATLIGSGAFRLWVWFQNRAQRGWQWLALSGGASLLAGLAIAAGWPENSVWVLGLLLALDLLLQGWTLIMVGLALHRI